MNYTILIADRNSHVREFLKREMTAEGFRVLEAEKGKDVVSMAYRCSPLDLILLDPDMPDTGKSFLLKKLGDRIPPIPVVIHTLDSEDTNYSLYLKQAVSVEKEGKSIERIKQIILEILEKKPQKYL